MAKATTTRKPAAAKADKAAVATTAGDQKVIVTGKVLADEPNPLANPGPERRQFTGYDEIQQYAPLLGLGVDGFIAAVAEDAPVPIPEEKVYGLLALERNGQNRTDYVKACIARLGLTEDDPLPGGGPGYTNDIHPVSDLYS